MTSVADRSALRSLATSPPPPFRRSTWRSPARGTWLTSVLGLVLLVGMPLLTLTGVASWLAYNPRFPGNVPTPETGWIDWLPALVDWPTQPAWLFRLNEGVHVLGGLALAPIVLVKLWSVIPRLFVWPPARTPAQAVERASVALLVGGVLLTFATGVLNIQYWYVFPGSFYRIHFYASWIFLAGFVVHLVVKLPLALRTVRDGQGAQTSTTDEDLWLEPTDPDPPTMSRRGVLAVAGGASATVLALSAGQVSSNDTIRRTALLAPRGRVYGDGPNDFQVNKPASVFGITREQAGDAWRLALSGPDGEVVLTRADLLAMEQVTHDLPIACVEGWSTSQTWTGVQLVALARMVGGGDDPPPVFVDSLQRAGAFRSTTLSSRQVRDRQSLLALRVNGADLSLDHGFPARVMVPANPGVHQTKWVTRLTLREDLR